MTYKKSVVKTASSGRIEKIVNELGIFCGSFYCILSEQLQIRKAMAQWKSHWLSPTCEFCPKL